MRVRRNQIHLLRRAQKPLQKQTQGRCLGKNQKESQNFYDEGSHQRERQPLNLNKKNKGTDDEKKRH